MIEVIGLSKQYGDKTGVANIDFKIEKGEVVGLLGPNGAGKSTIMKMIAGYLSPTAGKLVVDGLDAIENQKEVAGKIGFLPENPPLYVDMSVCDYLTFVAEIRGIPKKQRKEHITEIMELAQIYQVKERLIKNLSKGYRQRVGLAQALIGFPEILILDEPTVGLDPKQIKEVRGFIKNLSKTHTIIISSHILSEITMLCEKVIIINEGRLVAVDTVENLSDDGRETGVLFLKVKGDKEQVVALLKSIEGVLQVEDDENGLEHPNHCKLKVTTQKDGAVRECVFYQLAEHKLPILELRTLGHSLEEVFLQLTGEATSTAEREEVK